MTTIACVGIAVLDQIYTVNAMPDHAGKHFATGYSEVGGGPAATAAVAAARLGARSMYWGRVGDDAAGKRILEELADYGVDISSARRVEGAASSTSAILVDARGERLIVNHTDRSMDKSPDWLPLDSLGEVSAVLADVRWPDGAEAALSRAKSLGIPAVLDADAGGGDDMARLVAAATDIAFSDQGLKEFTGIETLEDAIREAARRTDGTVYVTLGSEGCVWLEGDELKRQSAFKVDVVDTTGAGDVFHGALVVALGEGMERADAVRFACGCASLKCTRPGGRAGIPERNDLLEFLK